MRLRPARKLLSSLFANQADRSLDLSGIRIAFLHQTHRQAVRTENQVDARTILELPQDGPDALRNRLHIQRMIVKLADRALRWPNLRRAVDPAPFFEAAQCRRIRKMRVERQKDDLLERPSFAQSRNGLLGERMPVAHSDHGDRINLTR